jgi:DNA-binding NarL/FixJ family response regulator
MLHHGAGGVGNRHRSVPSMSAPARSTMPRHSIVTAKEAAVGHWSLTLSEREQQVAILVCEGFSNKLIARKLDVVEGTVKAHLHSIYRKLGIRSRIELLDTLTTLGPIDPAAR